MLNLFMLDNVPAGDPNSTFVSTRHEDSMLSIFDIPEEDNQNKVDPDK